MSVSKKRCFGCRNYMPPHKLKWCSNKCNRKYYEAPKIENKTRKRMTGYWNNLLSKKAISKKRCETELNLLL
jgi:hypothetical protein